MNRRGRTAAFVLGLIAGIFNIIYGVIVLAAGGLAISAANTLSSFFSLDYLGIYDMAIGLEWGILLLFFLVSLLNLIGGCVVHGRRISGGIMMLITSLLLLSICFFLMSIPSATGVVVLLYLPFQVVSLIASIIAFIPPKTSDVLTSNYQYPQYGQQQYAQPPYQTYMPQPVSQKPVYNQPLYAQQQYPPTQYGQPSYAPPPFYAQQNPQFNPIMPPQQAPNSPPPADIRAAEATEKISPDE